MLIILKKIAYLLIIILINTYVCAYLGAKLSARMELRRGYRLTRLGGIGFPAIRFLSYLGRDSSASIWSLMVFIFSFTVWSVVPFTPELILIDMDSNLLVAMLFLLITAVLNVSGMDGSRYGIVHGLVSKRIIYVVSLIVPFFISVASLVLVSRTFNLKEVVDLQREYWNIVYQPLGFITAVISIVMVIKLLGFNREGKQGFSSISIREGSGMSWAIYRFSGYSIVLFMIYLVTILYLGGYKNLYLVRGDVMLGIKFYVVFIFILFAGKAVGSDMADAGFLMRVNGKFLIPLSILNFVITIGFFIYRNIYNFI